VLKARCGRPSFAVARIGAETPPIEATDLCDLIGYTVVACSNVEDEFEGADFDKPVRLDNGMVFQFTEYSYTYAYRPDAVVLATEFDDATKARLRAQGVPEWRAKLYKLVVEDEVYDVIRLH
jgi:hypothetical protein